MTRSPLIGWILTLAGIAVWTYGYVSGTVQPFVDWNANAPAWIAGYLPNAESEIGIALMFIAMVPMYWPQKRA